MWYIPHSVYHKRKKKIWVVFDCGSSFRCTSLNQELLQGPHLSNSLLRVILRFQRGCCCDSCGGLKLTSVNHWQSIRCWCTSLVLSLHLVVQIIHSRKPQRTMRVESVRRFFSKEFLCWWLTSLPDEDAAISLIQDLGAVCATGGFRLTKWTSNSHSLLVSIPDEEKAKEVKKLDLDRIQWNTETDSFYFKINLKEQQPSRRTILSTVNSIYDPIGFLAPLIVPVKRIQQELCWVNCGWDDKNPDGLIKYWEKWLEGLDKLNNLSIHR